MEGVKIGILLVCFYKTAQIPLVLIALPKN